MKKVITAVIVLLIVAIIVIVIFHALGSSNNAPAGEIEQGNYNPAAPKTVPVLSVVSSTPQGPTLTLGTSKGSVELKNFYLSNPPVDPDGTMTIASTNDYYITYDIPTSQFGIIISGASFNTVRPEVEAAFMSLLGVDQNDACKLDVVEGVPYSPDDPLSGKSFPLSFCAP